MNLARRHRLALCDTALAVGPEAPTLCSPWQTRDLLAHLIIRESRPDTWPDILAGVMTRHREQVQRAEARRPFEELVERVRNGPPRWAPTRWERIDDAISTTEFAVHHEDLLRAQPEWQPVPPDLRTSRALWSYLSRLGRLLYRRSPVGVVLVAPGLGRAAARRPPAGARSVVLTGDPLELTLHAFGRARTQVTIDGDTSDVVALSGSERAV